MVNYLCQNYPVSQRHACRTLRLNRATHQYQSHQDLRTALRQRLRELNQTSVRYGYSKITILLKPGLARRPETGLSLASKKMVDPAYALASATQGHRDQTRDGARE